MRGDVLVSKHGRGHRYESREVGGIWVPTVGGTQAAAAALCSASQAPALKGPAAAREFPAWVNLMAPLAVRARTPWGVGGYSNTPPTLVSGPAAPLNYSS